jgi:NADH-dependent peroxiredoxin subunit F
MFDVLIIGGGPAGMAAAVYLARQKMSVLILTGTVGGAALWSSDVENYLGFHLLNGEALVSQFKKHLDDYKKHIEWKEGEEVQRLTRKEGGFVARTAQGFYEGKTVLVATGTRHRTLGVPGEKELYGHGVTYCAACDAPLFAKKTVYVIGGGNSAMDAALFTEKYAAKVHLVTINAELKGDSIMINKVAKSKKIKLHTSTKTSRIIGRSQVTSIGLMGPDKEEKLEQADGVFVEIGLEPVADFIDFVEKDHYGQIVVDKYNATNVEGIWAAGDVTDVTEKQIAVAVGEGSKAGLSIVHYFQTHEV